jgi:uncharacterized protein (TIGR00369 family)
MPLPLEADRYCFVCGADNPEGLHCRFTPSEGSAEARYVIRPEHQGYAGIAHGGILATLLDEAMVYAAVSLGRWTATAEMTVRYVHPAPTDQPLTITAEVTRHQRRLVECRAEIRDAAGRVLASATGKLIQSRELTEDERRKYGTERTPPKDEACD